MKKALTSVLACTLLAGCGTQPTSPENRMFTKMHGVYWHSDPQKSLALNAYSLAGVQVNVEEAENASGGVDEGLASKMLLNTATGAITGGLKAGIGMFTASLYSEADAEFIQVPQFVVFVPNPTNLPFNDAALVKNGAKIIIDATKEHPKLNDVTYQQQSIALSECTITKSFMGPWDTCDTKTVVAQSGSNGTTFFKYQAIRPATGNELRQLNISTGNYTVVRYVYFMVKGLSFDTKGFPGFTLMPQTPKTAPGYASVSINGGEYYFIKGNLGHQAFPLKMAIN